MTNENENARVTFFSQHPGWSDTAAVRAALPGFYESLKGRLRSPREGADTVIWLAAVDASEAALRSGGFYFDRAPAAKHVSANALTGTRYSPEDVAEMERALRAARDEALAR
jgi:dehydrogenase/reductase SDR family protein 12